MTDKTAPPTPPKPAPAQMAPEVGASTEPGILRLLLRDPAAAVAVVVLAVIALIAAFGPPLVGDLAAKQNLSAPSLAPFNVNNGWEFFLGSDPLGRSTLARMVIASRTTLLISVPAVIVAFVVGSTWGLWVGFYSGWRETIAMRIADVILSFPSLLLAVVILYVFSPSAANIVLVLAITRIPVYLRTSRADAASLRGQTYVEAAGTFGAQPKAIVLRHILPVVLPTLVTLATLEFCYVMLAESSLSFLGIGVQAPDVTWGLMVAEGRSYLESAWWLSLFPGLAIVITTVCANLVASWMRIATDPAQRWRLTIPRRRRTPATLKRGARTWQLTRPTVPRTPRTRH